MFSFPARNTAVKDRDWWVIVEVPDAEVGKYRWIVDGEPDPFQTHLLPEIVNRFRRSPSNVPSHERRLDLRVQLATVSAVRRSSSRAAADAARRE